MTAAFSGHSRVVGVLLEKGANVPISDNDCTALHRLCMSVRGGHRHIVVAVTRLLVQAFTTDTEYTYT